MPVEGMYLTYYVATDIQKFGAQESPYTLGLMSVTSVIKMPVI
jgi:hypothetical protein